ncbi:MAG: hypothetical protein ACE5G2_04110 [Candidatus Krumholzibacteriia bacterium]
MRDTLGDVIKIAALAALVLGTTSGMSSVLEAVACSGCTLGIYDDIAMTRRSGRMNGIVKDLYAGIRYDPESEHDGMQGVEFSVSGLQPFVYAVEQWGPLPYPWGDIAAPEDTTNGTGGMAMAWCSCLIGDKALVKITLIALAPDDHVLRVLRKFPPTLPDFPFPLFRQCDAPTFTPTPVTGLSYTPDPTIAVDGRTWSSVKSLYR